jgi:hypothetical protein
MGYDWGLNKVAFNTAHTQTALSDSIGASRQLYEIVNTPAKFLV